MSSDKLQEAQRLLAGSTAAARLRKRQDVATACWFVSADGKHAQGPHTASSLIELYADRALPGEFLIWKEGMDDWRLVESPEGLREIVGAVAPRSAGRSSDKPDERGGVLSMSFAVPHAKPERSETAAKTVDKAPAAIERISSLVTSHMSELYARLGDELAALSDDQQRLYLAFELGALEFYGQSMLRAAYRSENEASQGFLTLLAHHAGEHYPRDSEAVISFWRDLQRERGMPETRRLGFDSIADGLTDGGLPKRGHYPAEYLREALGLPRRD